MSIPLLFLHGFGGAPCNAEALVLDPATLFAPALVGHSGASAAPAAAAPAPEAPERELLVAIPEQPHAHWALDRASFAAEVNRLAGWLNQQLAAVNTSGPVHLLGYSLGARLGLGLLHQHPHLFRGATLIGVHPGLANDDERRQRLLADLERCHQLLRDGIDAFMNQWENNDLFASQRLLPSSVWQRQAQLRRQHSASGLARSLLECGLAAMPDYSPALPGITCPVTLITGARDVKFSQLAESMCLSLRRGRHHEIEGASHNPLLERPAEVARLLRADLRATHRTAPGLDN